MTSVLVLLAAIGCGPRFEESRVDGLRRLTATFPMRGNGQRTIDVPVLDDETALIATAQVAGPNLVHLRGMDTPDATRVFDATAEAQAARSKTNAGFLGSAVSLNWPVLPSDAALVAGDWPLEIGVADADGFYVRDEVQLDVLLKSDGDLTSGTLRVAIVFAGPTANDSTLVAATRDAVAYWRELYANIGIGLEVTEAEYPEGDLEPPGFGSEQHYVAIAEQTGVGVVNVVLVPAITSVDDVYGIAGDIPAPLVPSPRTALLVSVEDAWGVDGEFSETEQRIFGETLAHEAGHLIGLFHPVEATYDLWDALDDTAECSGEQQCISRLGTNLMFPFPVCTLRFCTPQTELTAAQGAVANRYVGVD